MTFFAINKQTGEKVNSLGLLDNPKYQFPDQEEWIADWNEIINADEIKAKYGEVKVSFVVVEDEITNFKGTKYFVHPYFKIPNKTKMGIITVPESPEHKMAKNWIYNQTRKSDLELYYSSVTKPFRYVNSIKLSDLPINKQLIDIEVTQKNIVSRRADIICPFHYTHPFFGNGIIFEIQFSNQRDRTKLERSADAAFAGYSICWIEFNDFENLDDAYISIKDKALKIDAFSAILKYQSGKHIKNLKQMVQVETRKVRTLMMDELVEFRASIAQASKEMLSKKMNESVELLDEKYKQHSNFDDMWMSIRAMRAEVNALDAKMDAQPKKCPVCNAGMTEKSGPYGDFWGCVNFRSTGCEGKIKIK